MTSVRTKEPEDALLGDCRPSGLPTNLHIFSTMSLSSVSESFPFPRAALSEDTLMLPLWMAQFPFLFPKRGGLCLSDDSAGVIHFQVIKKLVY